MRVAREKEILELLEKEKYCEVETIASALCLSPSTVRRNLADLERKGLIHRVHGGAEIKSENAFNISFTFRTHLSSAEKKKIALSAVKLVKNGNVVFLDGSTTAFFMAEYLSEFSDVKVVTNSINTLTLLAKNGVTAYSTGGVVSKENPSILVGHFAEKMIDSVCADIAFFSAQSLNEKGEIYDCYEEELPIRLAMMRNAKKKVFLCDDTKFERNSVFRLCSLSEVDCFICNKNLKEKLKCESLPEIIAFE